MEAEDEKVMSEAEKVKQWHERITKAEKEYEPFHDLIKETREYYKNESKKNKHSIFWASVETMKPFLYFKQPRPYVDRKEKTSDPAEMVACKIIEKALAWDLAQFDFDSVIKYVRNDFLISGMGLAEEKYEAEFEDIVENGDLLPLKKSEKVVTSYIDPVDFIADVEKVGIWEDVTWVARKIWMTKQEVIDAFGEEVKDLIVEPGEKEYQGKDTLVYKIWDKKTSRIYWLSKECKTDFLKVSDDLLKLNGFFPMPKPIFATQANDSLIPVPDYREIRALLKEMDGLTERMRLTMKALKVSGAYDKAFPELANILDKEVTLVAVSDFQKLKDAGGIAGIIDFAPIKQYIDVLSSLAQRRAEIKAELFEITGVSDIMRGNSDPRETAQAVKQKTNFGSLRNQDRQNDMQRFICDLFKIKAEIICERFDAETLAAFVPNTQPKVLMQAVELLKTQKLRGMALGIETDTVFNQDAEAEKALSAVKTINEMINTAFQAVSAQPLLLPVYKQMIMSIVATLPNARQFEAVIDDALNKIAQQLSQPKQPQPNPQLMAVQNQATKNQQEFAIKKEQNQLKGQELALKKQAEDNKIAMQNKEAEMQFALKQEQIASGRNVTANISTGYVKGF